jgi:hypothetical protein
VLDLWQWIGFSLDLVLFGTGYVICGTAGGGMLYGELVEGMLFRELAQVEGGWLGHNDMIGNRLEHGLGCFGRLVLEKAKGMMESIADGGRGALHGVVDYSWCWLLWRLFGVLLHFSFGL